MEQNLNQVSSIFDAIISLFGVVFAFLPNWCLYFIGSILVFVIAIFIYKLIRG